MKQLYTHNYGLIILAAGRSSRLGHPKQLIKFNNKSFLQHTVDEANMATNNKVMVVTGANKKQVEAELRQLPVHVIHNKNWQDGIASSITRGLNALVKIFPYLDGIIIAVCDQPFITATVFEKLIERYQNGSMGIIASSYNDTTGVPALFGKQYFKRLFKLKGQENVKLLLTEYADDIEQVEFEHGNINIDTAEDYNDLLNSNKDVA